MIVRLTAKVNFGKVDYTRDEVQIGYNPHNAVLSLCTDGMHRPLLDVDSPPKNETLFRQIKFENAWLQWTTYPSSTEGHYHAACDTPMTWHDYCHVMESAVLLGFCDPKWHLMQLRRGYGVLRTPETKKETP